MIKFQTKLVTVRLNDKGQLHGNSYPAVEWCDGTKEWWHNGSRSHTRKCAILYPDKSKENWLHGLRHCYFIPSVIGCYASELRGESVSIRTGNRHDGYKDVTVKYPENPLLNNLKEKVMFHIHGNELSWSDWCYHPGRIKMLRLIQKCNKTPYLDPYRWRPWKKKK